MSGPTSTVSPTGQASPPSGEDLDSLLLIRHFELRLLDLYAAGELSGTTHTCLGQEHIPVALRPFLDMDDYVFSNHRGHGHYLARFGDPRGLLAEIMGRVRGVCGGVGGSQHLHRGRYLSTGVQGESLPVAAGVAFALRRSEPGRLACVHIGDGTWGAGTVYETLNIARLWLLPLVIIVENNGIAQSTPTERQLAGTIAGRAAAFDIPHHHVESDDIAAIRAELAPAFALVRRENRPVVIEFATRRLGPHSKGDDSRSPADIARLRREDWYARLNADFPDLLRRHEPAVLARLDDLVNEVRALPLSTWEIP